MRRPVGASVTTPRVVVGRAGYVTAAGVAQKSHAGVVGAFVVLFVPVSEE